eukprot:COSAG05_NODE_1686_length_4281_cov_3.599474_2_plen_225_part_00
MTLTAEASEAAVIAELERDPASAKQWYAEYLGAKAKANAGYRDGSSGYDLTTMICQLGSTRWVCSHCGCCDSYGTNSSGSYYDYGVDACWDKNTVTFACGATGSEDLADSHDDPASPFSTSTADTCRLRGRGQVGGVIGRWLIAHASDVESACKASASEKAARRAQFQAGTYAKTADGRTGRVVETAASELTAKNANEVKLRLVDGTESSWIKLDVLTVTETNG